MTETDETRDETHIEQHGDGDVTVDTGATPSEPAETPAEPTEGDQGTEPAQGDDGE